MIRAISIDDEPVALKVVENHADRIPYLTLLATFTNAFDALKYLSSNKVDLIFLDINMPDISGLEFLKSLSTKPHVVFTTAYSEHAVESYNLEAIDYLLKPFEFDRFLKAVNKVADLNSTDSKEHLFLKVGYEHVRIDIERLKYIKGDGNYVGFYTTDQKALCRMKMSEAEELLPNELFIKAHRSYVINRSKITKIEKHVVHLDKDLIPLSKTYYDALISQL